MSGNKDGGNRQLGLFEQLNEDDKRFLSRLLIVLLCSWIILALIPIVWIRLGPAFDSKLVVRSKDVLQQFGTFGDMFGAMNVLVSSIGFIGALAAVPLQSRQLKEQQAEIIKGEKEKKDLAHNEKLLMLLQAHTALLQNFTAIYTQNKKYHDAEYEVACRTVDSLGGADNVSQELIDKKVNQKWSTIRWMMEHEQEEVIAILVQIEKKEPKIKLQGY